MTCSRRAIIPAPLIARSGQFGAVRQAAPADRGRRSLRVVTLLSFPWAGNGIQRSRGMSHQNFTRVPTQNVLGAPGRIERCLLNGKLSADGRKWPGDEMLESSVNP